MDGERDPGACVKEYVLKPAVPAASSIDYKKELNEQQVEVVFAGAGPLLVIAGAGSGKTRTLTYRVARLLETGVPPSQILLLTFTNKAAREYYDQAIFLLGEEAYNTRVNDPALVPMYAKIDRAQ